MTNSTACRAKWEAAFKEWASKNELKMREYHAHLFGWLAACEWMNTRAPDGEAIGEIRWMGNVKSSGMIEVLWSDGEIPAVGTKLYTHPSATSDEVERDAARYRWLRENAYEYDDGLAWPNREFHFVDPTGVLDLDKTIDAALAKLGEKHDDAL